MPPRPRLRRPATADNAWLESVHAALVAVPDALLAAWTPVDRGDDVPSVSVVKGVVSRLDVGDGEALVLDAAVAAVWIPRDDGGVIAMDPTGAGSAAMYAAAAGLPDDAWTTTAFVLTLARPGLSLFEAASGAHVRPARAALRAALPPGRYALLATPRRRTPDGAVAAVRLRRLADTGPKYEESPKEVASTHEPPGAGVAAGAIETFTAADAALLARGYPHLRLLQDDHPDDRAAASRATRAAAAVDPFAYRVHWPRRVAAAYLRACGGPRFVRGAGALSVEEITAIVGAFVPPPLYRFHVAHVLFLAEAFAGPALAAEAVVARLERAVARDTAGDAATRWMLHALGFVRRRLPAAARPALDARLAALEPELPLAARGELAVALRGGAAPARLLVGQSPQRALHVEGDADLVARCLARQPSAADGVGDFRFDVRFAYLAGAPALAHFARTLQGVARGDEAFFVEQLGCVRHPTVVQIMATMTARREGGAAARAWLATHAAYARPVLAQLAVGTSRDAERAQALLADEAASP